MSKAFTREDDDLPERPTPARSRISHPTGVRNPITPEGARRLREELDALRQAEETGVAVSTGAKAQSAATERRIADLETILATTQVTPPPAPPWDQVRFGALVAVRESTGVEMTYRIVGMEETDADRDWIGCRSPLARALLGSKVGQSIRLDVPGGQRVLEIRSIGYP